MKINCYTEVNVKLHLLLVEIFLAIISIIAITSLVIACSDVKSEYLYFSLDKSVTILGVFVSALGLVIAGYFVVLAVNAYSHVRKIEALIAMADEFRKKYKEHDNRMSQIVDAYSQYLYDDICEHIFFIGQENQQKSFARKKQYHLRRRARLSLLLPDIPLELFNKCIIELGDLGDAGDLEKLKKNRKLYKEDRAELVNFVIDYMEEKQRKIASLGDA